MNDTTVKSIRKTLKRDAKALGIPTGAAESFINQALLNANKTLKNKSIVTEDDVSRIIVKELKKYNKDLAYVYKNRGTII